jgi:hypothetical protein
MNNDPDPSVHFNGIRIILFSLMRIRILLLNKVMEPMTTGLQTLRGSILSLTVRIHGPQCSVVDRDPVGSETFGRIWIRILKNHSRSAQFRTKMSLQETDKFSQQQKCSI